MGKLLAILFFVFIGFMIGGPIGMIIGGIVGLGCVK